MRLRLIRRAKWFVLCLVSFVIFVRTQYNLQINTEDFTKIHVPHVQNESILVHEVEDPNVGSQQMQHNCSEWFEDNFHLNIERVKLHQNMHDKRVNNTLKSSEHFQDVRFPVIVTAASRDFFDISQGLIQSIYVHLVPKYEDVKLIYYDMGLTELQRNIFSNVPVPKSPSPRAEFEDLYMETSYCQGAPSELLVGVVGRHISEIFIK
ncbi:uncharacterized protein LOC128246117 [Mya arenaria]|uniref:uncharacterized protein LOC128246117 n=1 Tax=Mya arenaria TaxID=6604 RepID=UPI0022E1E233|nr:uncharacterized protein LOC128246117 [Mya arenaria]